LLASFLISSPHNGHFFLLPDRTARSSTADWFGDDLAIKPLTPVPWSAMMMRDGQDRHNVVVNHVNNIVRESSDNELTGAISSTPTDGWML